MKIFLVCNSLGGGGAERVHVNLANGFAQRGHEVYLVADTNMEVSYPVDDSVHVLPLCPKTGNKFVKWGKAISLLRKNIKKFRPDVVIGNMHLCSIVSRVAAIGTNTPVVMTIHHALESKEYDGFSKSEIFMDKHFPSLYAATTVLTEGDAEVMRNKYHQRKRIFVMPNPLTFTPVTEIPSKENIVLAAGRLNDWKYKGWDLLIQAAGRIKPLLVREGWKIQIAGDGPESSKAFLADLCKQVGVKDVVEFLGYRTDMKELYQRLSIFCLSSRSEGLPMVLIEAMSQGCAPVACENLGRTKEIITNESEGLLFKTADVDDLSEKLTKMITDEEYRTSVQKNAIERSKYYSIDHVIGMWENMLKEIM